MFQGRFVVTVYQGQESSLAFQEDDTQRSTENALGWRGNVAMFSANQDSAGGGDTRGRSEVRDAMCVGDVKLSKENIV